MYRDGLRVEIGTTYNNLPTNERYTALIMIRIVKPGGLRDIVFNNVWVNFHAVILKKSWDIELQWNYEIEIGTYNNLPY